MGVPVGYDGNVEQRNTHTMLLPMVETERATIPEKELLKGIVVLSPAKQNTTSKKVPKKVVPRGGDSKSISSRSGATSKKRSVLGESKYWPKYRPQWKAGGSRYLNLYTTLLHSPSRKRTTMLLEDKLQAKLGNGWIIRRQIRNQ